MWSGCESPGFQPNRHLQHQHHRRHFACLFPLGNCADKYSRSRIDRIDVKSETKPTMSVFGSFRRWLSLKQYQLEVTFSVYMFTPWEKFFFSKPSRHLSCLPSLARIAVLWPCTLMLNATR